MARTPDRLTPEQKDVIYELKRQGLTGDQVVERLKAGYEGMRPIKLSRSRVNEIYRRRAENEGVLFETTIEGLTDEGALDKLTKRLLRLAEREIAWQETRQKRHNKIDPGHISKLAGALERIHKLSRTRAVPKPSKGNTKGPGAAKPSSFAAKLAESGEQAEPIGDVVLPGPPPGTPDPAQPAPAGQSSGGPGEESVTTVPVHVGTQGD